MPLIGSMGKHTAIMYKQMNLPVVVAFHEKESVLFGAMEELFTALAKRLRGSMLFTYGDPFENGPAVDAMFPQKGHDEPRVAILWLASEHQPQKFEAVAEKQNIQEWLAELEAWITGYYARLHEEKEPEETSKPLRSEPIPLSQDGPYTKVVAKNWDTIVEDPRKDVLIIIHRPDTDNGVPGPSDLLLKHMAKLKPFIEHVDTLVLAEMNGKLNTVPKEYRTPFFPIMRLFPAGKSPKSPVFYTEKDGTLRIVLKWLLDKATNKFHIDWSAVPYEDPRNVPLPMNVLSSEELEKSKEAKSDEVNVDFKAQDAKVVVETPKSTSPDAESEFFSD
eukprot:CAMPEP_0198734964 /NCGR_PEP_ID=MMETSP1475-20131203/56273_1 /TAXON_ID= ORGANISM="Unidentified sp., Strain CCMP1999" /NCGR_SAMPLE_ID=MMETSP1475 /ASSEMBLY_ACC=CAM_ASM_001111 /LENGTH=332 /DNA_ID=CAMNT_0044498535 /DNA_START=24 /DNA_END=1022 /DNA_ORIENTATION=-